MIGFPYAPPGENAVIRTERLRIAPFTEADITERYISWLNDPEVVRYSDQRFRRHTAESCRAYLRSFEGRPNHFWSIALIEPPATPIGTMTAYIDENHRVADVGILIGEKKMWGKGYGLEAWRGVCRYLLGPRGMRKVTAGTLEVNRAMMGIARRAGMVEEGRRVRQCLWEGREVDLVLFALFGPLPNISPAP